MDQNQPSDKLPVEVSGVPQHILDDIEASKADIREGRIDDAHAMVAELRARHEEWLASRRTRTSPDESR